MNKNEALNILKAFAICNVRSRKLTCADYPFVGEIIKENGGKFLPCSYYNKISSEKVEEAIIVLSGLII